jgi:mannobiose 2-epimerase
MKLKRIWPVLGLIWFIAGFIPAFAKEQPDFTKYLAGEYWRQQALTEIIPFWIPTIDKKGGGFFTDIKNNGSIGWNRKKYPRMISRAVYGFSAAYLLSGDKKYLDFAKHGLNYLKKYGWDKANGGWFTELDAQNRPTVDTKDLFDESYGNLGPIFYYYATGDQSALNLVQKTHQLLKEKAWDKEYQGYYTMVARDWSQYSTEKSFNSQIDIATAYLIYYYLALKDPALLNDIKDIGNVAVNHMYDPECGYIHEWFDREWQHRPCYLGNKNQVEVGHNLKTAWVLFRTYQLTREPKYREYAKKIAGKLLDTAWDKQNYGWYFTKNDRHPAAGGREKSKCWWTQTEGNFMLLNLYHITKETRYLDYFRKNAYFWDKYLVDHRHKEVYSYVTQTGHPLAALKGDLYKSAYHTMENALMNYLYLELYVHKKTATLYFNLSAATEGAKHYVNILEDPAVAIQKVEIDGADWDRFDARKGYVVLPKGNGMNLKVTLGVRE